jgi:DHA1 family bicyclomycin/chloramphenicol resistance-like MFS transporter
MALFYGFLAGAPFVVMGLLGQTATMYGIMFIAVSGAFMVGNLVAARISPRVGVVRMVRLGSLVVLAGSAVALLAAFVLPWSLTALFAPMVVIAAAQGASMPNAQAGVVSAMPQLAGAASGLGGFLQMGLAALAAQAVGMVQNDTPYPMLVAMLACGIGTVVFSLVADLPRRPTHHG